MPVTDGNDLNQTTQRSDAVAKACQVNAHLLSDGEIQIARPLLLFRAIFKVEHAAGLELSAAVAGQHEWQIAAIMAVTVEHVASEQQDHVVQHRAATPFVNSLHLG